MKEKTSPIKPYPYLSKLANLHVIQSAKDVLIFGELHYKANCPETDTEINST